MKKLLIVLLGPTGVGKTKVSLQIAQHFNTEIISSDSRQVYKELAIGTAIPLPEKLKVVKHHFIQTKSIHETYNASLFENEALEVLQKLFLLKNLAIMAGGSMLYIDAVCNGIDDLPTVDPEIRATLAEKFDNEGVEILRRQLKKLDPEYYSEVDLKNPKRILHALEICLMTGKPYSTFRTNKVKTRPFEILKVGLNCERSYLYERINSRVDEMVKKGLINEAQKVYKFKGLNALNTVGYKELFSHFDGEIPLETAIDKIKTHTRNYARKQLTWFRKDKNINWFLNNATNDIIKFIEEKVNE